MKIDALCNVGMNQVAIFYNSEKDQDHDEISLRRREMRGKIMSMIVRIEIKKCLYDVSKKHARMQFEYIIKKALQD